MWPWWKLNWGKENSRQLAIQQIRGAWEWAKELIHPLKFANCIDSFGQVSIVGYHSVFGFYSERLVPRVYPKFPP